MVFVIDVSGSMDGNKIKLVKDTLEFIIEELTDKDRVALITFNHNSKMLTNLNPMTRSNKRKYKWIINNIEADGNTNI